VGGVEAQQGQPRETSSGLWARRGLWLGLAAIAISYICTLLLAQPDPVLTVAWCGLI